MAQNAQQHKSFDLYHCIKKSFDNLITSLKGETPKNLYDIIRMEAEKVLFQKMIERTKDNECEMSRQLKIARGTLRSRRKALELARIRKRRNRKAEISGAEITSAKIRKEKAEEIA